MGMFATMASEHEAVHPFRSPRAFLHELLSFDCLCGVYAAVVCIVGYGYVGVVHMLVEGLLLIALVAAVVSLNMWRKYLEVHHTPSTSHTQSPSQALHPINHPTLSSRAPLALPSLPSLSIPSWSACFAPE